MVNPTASEPVELGDAENAGSGEQAAYSLEMLSATMVIEADDGRRCGVHLHCPGHLKRDHGTFNAPLPQLEVEAELRSFKSVVYA